MAKCARHGVVHLTPEECDWAVEVSRRRNQLKTKHGIEWNGTWDGLDDPRHMHLRNALGELAVAKLYGGEWDTRDFVAGSVEGNVILPHWLGRGRASTRDRRGREFVLKSDKISHFYGEYGFLVWPVLEYFGPGLTLEVMGWITKPEFERVAVVKQLLGPRLACPVSRMHRVTEKLKPYIPESPQLDLFSLGVTDYA